MSKKYTCHALKAFLEGENHVSSVAKVTMDMVWGRGVGCNQAGQGRKKIAQVYATIRGLLS